MRFTERTKSTTGHTLNTLRAMCESQHFVSRPRFVADVVQEVEGWRCIGWAIGDDASIVLEAQAQPHALVTTRGAIKRWASLDSCERELNRLFNGDVGLTLRIQSSPLELDTDEQ